MMDSNFDNMSISLNTHFSLVLHHLEAVCLVDTPTQSVVATPLVQPHSLFSPPQEQQSVVTP